MLNAIKRPLGIQGSITIILGLGFILFVGSFLLYFADVSYNRDVYYLKTNLFMEFEQKSLITKRFLIKAARSYHKTSKTNPKKSEGRILELSDKAESLSPELQQFLKIFAKYKQKKGHFLAELGDVTYLALNRHEFLPVSLKELFQNFNLDPNSQVWVYNRQGQMLHSNRYTIQAKMEDHPLIQNFIRSKLNSGFLEYSRFDERFLGFYQVVAGTNLILLTEMAHRSAFQSLYSSMFKLVVFALLVAVVVFSVNYLLMRRLVRPLKQMKQVAENIIRGDYSLSLIGHSNTEIGLLSQAMMRLQATLAQKEDRISKLFKESVRKTQYETEMKVLELVQSALLPDEPLSTASDLVIASIYKPSAYASGDWYTYHYNEVTEETIVMVVDISGHGAGPAMFTTAIATQFDNFIGRSHSSPDYLEFIASIERTLLNLGSKKWMATLMLVVYRNGDDAISLYSAGHTPAILVDFAEEASRERVRSLALPSNPIGLDQLQIASKKIPFTNENRIVIYTDGVTEATNANGKQFGKRQFRKEISKLGKDASPRFVVESLHKAAVSFTENNGFDDDVCLICIDKRS